MKEKEEDKTDDLIAQYTLKGTVIKRLKLKVDETLVKMLKQASKVKKTDEYEAELTEDKSDSILEQFQEIISFSRQVVQKDAIFCQFEREEDICKGILAR